MRRVLMVVGGLLLLVLIVVAVQGYQDARARADDRDKFAKLSHTSILLGKVLAAIKPAKGTRKVSPLCAYLAAGAYRLAEARNLQMTREGAEAAVLAEMDIVREIMQTGSEPVYVVAGLASRVYSQSAAPDATFELEAARCMGGR